eukprot:s1267_g24.t1
MLRRIPRCAPDEFLSHQALLHQSGLLDVRVRLAIDRLLYAAKLFHLGPSYLQQLVHLEKQHCEDSWLDGLLADLHWLQRSLPHALPFQIVDDLTEIIEYWQEANMPWKGLLKRAVKRWNFQEHMMHEVHRTHCHLLALLREAGATFEPEYAQVISPVGHELFK